MLEIADFVSLAFSAGEVWNVVSAFNNLPNWHPWWLSSDPEAIPGGAGRRVRVESGEIIEQLTFRDASSRE